MSNKLFQDRLLPFIVFVKRSLTIQSDFDLGNQMKLLNNNKQFKKTLDLFDEHQKNNIETCSSLILTQVLKACAQTGDLQRGKIIHNLISSRLKTDSYILTSLIHLYSKF
jgi:hypothetical protein